MHGLVHSSVVNFIKMKESSEQGDYQELSFKESLSASEEKEFIQHQDGNTAARPSENKKQDKESELSKDRDHTGKN